MVCFHDHRCSVPFTVASLFDAIRTLIEAIGDAVGALTPLLGVAGIIVGATVTGIVTRRNDVRRTVTDIRREVYFETMDVAVSLYDELRRIGLHGPRGGDDPRADQEAADAINEVIKLMPTLVRVEARVATVGSPAVVEAAYAFRRATIEYMGAMSSQEMFRVGVATLHFGHYAASLDRLSQAIRVDLALAPLTSTLPVTRDAVERAARLPSPGWWPDPTMRFDLRWWNGAFWDDAVITGGQRYTDHETTRTAIWSVCLHMEARSRTQPFGPNL